MNAINYHVSIKGQKSGPHTLDDVKAMKISDEDLVWNENMKDWQKAMYVIELYGHIALTPPRLPENKLNETKAINRSISFSLIPFFITFIWSFSSLNNTNKFFNDQEYVILGCILIALIPTLIVLIIVYRYIIKKEIKRLGIN